MYHVAMERRRCVWRDGGCKSITDGISCVLSWFARIETGEEIVKLSPVELQTRVHMKFHYHGDGFSTFTLKTPLRHYANEANFTSTYG